MPVKVGGRGWVVVDIAVEVEALRVSVMGVGNCRGLRCPVRCHEPAYRRCVMPGPEVVETVEGGAGLGIAFFPGELVAVGIALGDHDLSAVGVIIGLVLNIPEIVGHNAGRVQVVVEVIVDNTLSPRQIDPGKDLAAYHTVGLSPVTPKIALGQGSACGGQVVKDSSGIAGAGAWRRACSAFFEALAIAVINIAVTACFYEPVLSVVDICGRTTLGEIPGRIVSVPRAQFVCYARW